MSTRTEQAKNDYSTKRREAIAKLQALFLPEQLRLRRKIVEAIERVLNLVYESGEPSV